MKKSLLALAVAAAVSPAAFAQTNVTLYGIADVGVSGDRTGLGGQSTAIRVNSGYMSTSRFGITGTEDLGAGLKGIFTLELGFNGDTGGFTSYRGNPGAPTASPQTTAGTTTTNAALANTNQFGSNISAGFNRRSFVGLQSAFGTIALGRDYTPFFWAQLATDNLGYGLYGNLLNSTALSGTGSELFSRVSNAIFYTSPKFAGLTIRGSVSAGSESFAGSNNVPGVTPRLANQFWGLGAEYGLGPLSVAAAYQQVRLATVAAGAFTGGTNIRRDWTVGAKYNFGLFSLGGGYAQIDPRDFALVTAGGIGPVNDNRQYWLGGTVGLGRGSLIVQWNRVDQKYAAVAGLTPADGKADTWAVSYTYPFSRRTTAYATLGYVRNNNSSALGLFASDNVVGGGGGLAARGADPRGFALGVRHSF